MTCYAAGSMGRHCQLTLRQNGAKWKTTVTIHKRKEESLDCDETRFTDSSYTPTGLFFCP